ncbi:MAG: MMPL family transporter [Thermoleophilia bacterium]|nr:MMPL family transporter [Thermoleophilia bacterium]
MFARLGSFAVRFRWFIIAAWVVVAVILTLVAPNIDDVAVSDQRAFLPTDAPSLHAHDMVAEHFPDRVSPSSAVLVIDAGPGGRVDQGEVAAFVSDLTTWLSGPETPEGVDEVWSPVLGDEQTKAGLTSQDKQVALVVVRFETMGTEPETIAAFDTVHERLSQAPEGVETLMTGDGPILAAYTGASQKSTDSTTWITIVLVVAILLLIYRSPVSPFIPLFTIALAYLISRGVVALLGAHGLTISLYTNVFLIVVLFGAGTDYCLFLISRFREEMTGVSDSAPAAKTTVRAVGETIASSAGTVIVGLAMMTFAELGLYNTSGPSLAIGVAIALLAGLTLTPALLTILGHHAFWPRKARHMTDTGVWHRWAGKVVKRPVVAFIVPVIVLVPFAIYGSGLNNDFDLLADLSRENEARMGFDRLSTHFGSGEMQPLNVVAIDPAGYDTPSGLKRTEELAATLSGMAHVAKVRSFTGSLEDKSFLGVAGQLTEVAQGVREGTEELRDALAMLFASDTDPVPDQVVSSAAGQLQAAADRLVDVGVYLMQLAAAYPEVLQDPGYQKAAGALSRLSELGQSVGSGPETDPAALGESAQQALTQLASLYEGLESLQGSFAAKPDAILLPDLYLRQNEGLNALREAYISADGTAVRLQVVLDSGPYSQESISTVEAMRQTLSAAGFDAVIEGNSAVLLDLRDSSDRDMTRAIIFVLGGVFVVLLLLLRALVAPIYLILTILLSYAATLGVVRLVFVDIVGTAGVTWWVPMFMFVMLVALGMDYNIFLIGRVKEEVTSHGTRAGTRLALARTGGIITSAGVIMAGTFASMLSGDLLGLLQIGFAVAFGVLLDTFVVRTTLVPAITVLLDRWAWWPRKGPKTRPRIQV